MNTEQYNIVVSQEFLESAKVDVYVPYPDGGGRGEPAWTGLTYLLSGGTNGASVLTGLTIPIMFKQTYKDIGYYSGFDGAIYQKDINNNFIYSGVTGNSAYTLYLYNTSDASNVGVCCQGSYLYVDESGNFVTTPTAGYTLVEYFYVDDNGAFPDYFDNATEMYADVLLLFPVPAGYYGSQAAGYRQIAGTAGQFSTSITSCAGVFCP